MRSDETSTVTVGDRINAIGALSTSSSDPLELFKQAAQTFQTPPAIYQRHRLGLEDLPKVCPFHHWLAKLIPMLEPTQVSCTSMLVIWESKGQSSRDSRALMRSLAQRSYKHLTMECVPAQVADWRTVKSGRGGGPARHSILSHDHSMSHDRSSPKTSKVNKAKGQTSGRTYTSKYRGVHQTFPTKRWEAQFR